MCGFGVIDNMGENLSGKMQFTLAWYGHEWIPVNSECIHAQEGSHIGFQLKSCGLRVLLLLDQRT